jgi:hypothetical protein
MWEESGVDGVHGGEIVHVFEEDGCFDDVTETAVAGVEDGLQVFERLGLGSGAIVFIIYCKAARLALL